MVEFFNNELVIVPLYAANLLLNACSFLSNPITSTRFLV